MPTASRCRGSVRPSKPANRSGGVNGRRLVLPTHDDGNDPAGPKPTRQLAGQGVFVLFGSIEGNPSAAVANAAVQTSTPFFGPMAGALSCGGPISRWCSSCGTAEHRDEFKALMEQGRRRIGLRRVALFHSDSASVASTDRREAGAVDRSRVRRCWPFKSDITDDSLTGVAAPVARQGVDLLLNHGSAGVSRPSGAGSAKVRLRLPIRGVNWVAAGLTCRTRPLWRGMIFSPGRAASELQDGAGSPGSSQGQNWVDGLPGTGSRTYGGLEGFMPADAGRCWLPAGGRQGPTPDSAVAAGRAPRRWTWTWAAARGGARAIMRVAASLRPGAGRSRRPFRQ